eukprot:6308914-Prymnesium_polylepis.2
MVVERDVAGGTIGCAIDRFNGGLMVGAIVPSGPVDRTGKIQKVRLAIARACRERLLPRPWYPLLSHRGA